jgi:hypothetical protein
MFCYLWQDNDRGLLLHAGGVMGSDVDAENYNRSESDNLNAMLEGIEDESEAVPSNDHKWKKKRYHCTLQHIIQELKA